MQERIEKIERRLDRLDQSEKKHDFTIRDSSVKIGIAEGLSKTTHHEISQLKLEMVEVRAEMRELRTSSDQQFENLQERIDTLEERFYQKLDVQEQLLKQILEKLQ